MDVEEVPPTAAATAAMRRKVATVSARASEASFVRACCPRVIDDRSELPCGGWPLGADDASPKETESVVIQLATSMARH